MPAVGRSAGIPVAAFQAESRLLHPVKTGQNGKSRIEAVSKVWKKASFCLLQRFPSGQNLRLFFHAHRLGGELYAQGGSMKRKLFVFAVLFSVAAVRTQADGCLSGDDRRVVATCIVLEAGGEGLEGMQAVLSVMLNRASGDLNRLVPEITRYGAFSCMSPIWRADAPDYDPLFSRAENQPAPFADAMMLIALMEEGFLRDNTGGATHYHATSILPYWADSLRYLTTIGNHCFYVERGRETASL